MLTLETDRGSLVFIVAIICHYLCFDGQASSTLALNGNCGAHVLCSSTLVRPWITSRTCVQMTIKWQLGFSEVGLCHALVDTLVYCCIRWVKYHLPSQLAPHPVGTYITIYLIWGGLYPMLYYSDWLYVYPVASKGWLFYVHWYWLLEIQFKFGIHYWITGVRGFSHLISVKINMVKKNIYYCLSEVAFTKHYAAYYNQSYWFLTLLDKKKF